MPLTFANAAGHFDPLVTIQKKWAECQYQRDDKDDHIFCLENLIKRTEKAVRQQPDNAGLKVWLAINKSSLAGVRGGLGALSLVKDAKKILEGVIETEPTVLKGSAYTSLGSLYYKVPGWPLGFGDDKKAEKMLKKALEINPDGIDPNYFYGDFLAENGEEKQAIKYLTKALHAPARKGRELADAGRRKEIESRIKEISQ
ncbi:hypothetical protein LRQ06_13800 [Vibrio sp. DNF-1]|nr:hypothetical protein [Vibrio salinus]MCE0494923.1 hypothetical protein [Vibrio salinus]